MKWWLSGVLTLSLLMGFIALPTKLGVKRMHNWLRARTDDANSKAPHTLCALFNEHQDWKTAAEKTQAKWGVPINVQMAIMKEESQFESHAKNPKSSALGFAQVVNKTWQEYKTDENPNAKRTSFADASDFIGWYTQQIHDSLDIHKDNAFKVYMAYHEGLGAYHKAIDNPNASVQKISKKVERYADKYQQQLSQPCEVPDED